MLGECNVGNSGNKQSQGSLLMGITTAKYCLLLSDLSGRYETAARNRRTFLRGGRKKNTE